MNYKKIKILTTVLSFFFIATVNAQLDNKQDVIPASGGNASGSGGSSSYSVGQVVYTTNSSVSNGTVAQGIQQPYEISVVTEIEEAKGISLQFTVFPNPTIDNITLKIETSATLGIQSLSYYLYDSNEKLIENKKIEGNETLVSVESLVPATYFLKIIQGKKEVKTFKIIKVS